MSEMRQYDGDTSRRGFLCRSLAVCIALCFGDLLFDDLRRSSLRNQSNAFAEVPDVDLSAPGCPDTHCLTQREQKILELLTIVIIPSDETAPGAKEAGVFQALHRRLAANPHDFQRYSDGLRAFDDLARNQYGHDFVDLPYEKQVGLFALVDEARKHVWPSTNPDSLFGRIELKLNHWYYRRVVGVSNMLMIFQDRLMKDTTLTFYVTKLAWDSLGYSGPPFPFGYIGRKPQCASLS